MKLIFNVGWYMEDYFYEFLTQNNFDRNMLWTTMFQQNLNQKNYLKFIYYRYKTDRKINYKIL